MNRFDLVPETCSTPQAVKCSYGRPHRTEPVRHRVSILCRRGTKVLRRRSLRLIESASKPGNRNAFPQGVLPMSRVLAIVGFLCACSAAFAVTLQQLTPAQLTQSATSIVRARVTGSSASFTGSTVYTHYTLQVSETWKGSTPAEVMLPGGVAGGYRQSFPGVPSLQIGNEYVLYLWKSPRTGITHIVGLSQGIFYITQQSNGALQASRPRIGETMLDASGHTVRDQAIQMLLSDLKSQVTGGSAQ